MVYMVHVNNELINFLKKRRKDYILSTESYEDENIVELGKKKFLHLHGISLNKDIYNMPFYTWIKYSFNDKYNTHYPDDMFDVIYDLSEFKEDESLIKFITEAERIIRNNGIIILKKEEGLKLAKMMSKVPMSILSCLLHRKVVYSSLLILKPKKLSGKLPKEISIICKPAGKFEGTAIQVETVRKRLAKYGVKANVYNTIEEAPKKQIRILQWEAGLSQPLPKDKSIIIESHTLMKDTSRLIWAEPKYMWQQLRYYTQPSTVYWYGLRAIGLIKSKGVGKKENWKEFNKELETYPLLVRTYEMAYNNDVGNYTILPHLATKTTEQISREIGAINLTKAFHIGTCGHAAKSKRLEDICELAIRLDIKATIMVSVNELHKGSIKETSSYANEIFEKYNNANNGKIRVLVGQWSYQQLTKELRKCTHLISAQTQARSVSNSMRFMISIGRPLISVENYQAKEVQAIRVDNIDDIDHYLLAATRRQLTNLDDGMHYLLCILKMANSGKFDKVA